MIERRVVDGRPATVAYLSADFALVDRGRAAIIKVIYDDGDLAFVSTERHQQDLRLDELTSGELEGWTDSHPRDLLDAWLEDAKKAARVAKAKKQQRAKQRKQSGRNLPRKPRVKKVEQYLGEEPLEVGILTAGDDRVCDECDDYAAGAPYDIDEVEDSLPIHPNCRCTWFPWDDKRFAHDEGPPDFIKDPLTGQFGGSHSKGGTLTPQERRQAWTEETEKKRQAWLAKFGKPSREAALGEVEGKYKNWQPSKDVVHHQARIKEILAKQAQVSTTYRWQMKMYSQEADKFAAANPSVAGLMNANVVSLKAKIGESFFREAKLKQAKGTAGFGTVNALIAKAAGLGVQSGTSRSPLSHNTRQAVALKSMAHRSQMTLAMEPEAFFGSALEVSGWEKVGGQKGSNPGGTYVDPLDDSQWYVKQAQSEDHLANDLLTQRLYKLAGLNVPEQKKVELNEMPAVASKLILNSAGEPAGTLADAATSERALAIQKLQAGFAVDAWLGNRDVIGLVNDNVLMDYKDGILTPARIDFGGGLKYRAQGEEKPFTKAANEINSLRDPSINKQSAAVFGDMTNKQIGASIDKVLALTPGQIKTEAALLGIPEVGETLVARRQWLAQWAEQNEASTPSTKVVAASAATGIQEQPPVKAKSAPAEPAQSLTPEPVITPEETKKASKAGPFYPAPTTPQGQSIVKPFNEKWATKTEFTQQELVQKVTEYKATKAKLESIATMEQQAQATAAAEQKAKYEKENAAKIAKEKAEAAKAKAELAGIATELGISEGDADAVNALVGLSGGSVKTVVADFKKFQEEGKHQGLPISPFQYALLQSYVGSAYININEQLRKGFWDIRTHVFANAVNAALAKLPAYNKALKRGIGLTTNEQGQYKEGQIVLWNAFSSCGKSGSFNKNTICHITPLQTDKTRFRDLGKLNPHEAGGEVLGMARSALKVTKSEGSPGGKMNVWLQEVEVI